MYQEFHPHSGKAVRVVSIYSPQKAMAGHALDASHTNVASQTTASIRQQQPWLKDRIS